MGTIQKRKGDCFIDKAWIEKMHAYLNKKKA